jgi:hypothetical protein
MVRKQKLVDAAMTLGFVSAVEQNLLNFPATALARIDDDKDALLSQTQIDALERHLSSGAAR